MKKGLLHILLFTLVTALLLSGCGGRRTHSSVSLGGMASSGESAQTSQSENSSFLGTEPTGETSVTGTYRLTHIAVGSTYDGRGSLYSTTEQYLKLATSDSENPDYIAPEDLESVRQQIAEECVTLLDDGTGEVHSPYIFAKTMEIFWTQKGDAVSLYNPEKSGETFECRMDGDRLMLNPPDYSDDAVANQYLLIYTAQGHTAQEGSDDAVGGYSLSSVAEDGKISTVEELLAQEENPSDREEMQQELEKSGLTLREDGTGELRMGETMELLWWHEGEYVYLTSLGSGESFTLKPCPFDGEELRLYFNGDDGTPDLKNGDYVAFTKK